MANHHVGTLADVLKHLVLTEVLGDARPQRYAETHAGSAAYPLVDDPERRYGVLGLLDSVSDSPSAGLARTRYARLLAGRARAEPPVHPGSALLAMSMLGDDAAYLLCDTDPASAEDLRRAARSLGLGDCEVAERDGMAAVGAWLSETSPTVVHIDPFDPWARDEDHPSALDLASAVAETGHGLVYWYGYSTPADRAWAVREIRAGTSAGLWWVDGMVTTATGETRDDGDLGRATSPGTGCGVVVAHTPHGFGSRCERLVRELGRLYDGRPTPDGVPGRLDIATGHA